MTGDFAFGPALRERIAARLHAFTPQILSPEELRRAAVVIALVPGEQRGQAACLLTHRPETLNRHAGQFALPGGRLDAGETEADAALRELQEELGLATGPAAILGSLDDFATRSGFRIRPFVVWIDDDSSLAPDPREVAACFRVPLAELAVPGAARMLPLGSGEAPMLCLDLPSTGQQIYAPTAAILYQFREVALAGRATRVSHLAQPRFTWN